MAHLLSGGQWPLIRRAYYGSNTRRSGTPRRSAPRRRHCAWGPPILKSLFLMSTPSRLCSWKKAKVAIKQILRLHCTDI